MYKGGTVRQYITDRGSIFADRANMIEEWDEDRFEIAHTHGTLIRQLPLRDCPLEPIKPGDLVGPTAAVEPGRAVLTPIDYFVENHLSTEELNRMIYAKGGKFEPTLGSSFVEVYETRIFGYEKIANAYELLERLRQIMQIEKIRIMFEQKGKDRKEELSKLPALPLLEELLL